MQHGGQRHHRERITQAIREEIASILQGELADPRIGSVVISDVQMGAGGKSVRVYVQIEGGEHQARATLKGLTAAKGYIRHELAERLGLQKVPDLAFEHDRSVQYGSRIDELLQRIEKRKPK
jgi:ribosome-binding factor A